MGKRDVFELLDRDCVNSQTTEFIKNYINDITTRNNNYAMKNKNLGVELSRVQHTLNEERKLNDGFDVSDTITKLKQQLEAKANEIKRLNLDAQKWFDIAMDLLHGKTKPEDYK